MFILSSSHLRGPLSSERCVQKGVRRLSRRRYAIISAQVGLDGVPDIQFAQLSSPSTITDNQFSLRADYIHGMDTFSFSTYLTPKNGTQADAAGRSRPMADLTNKPFNSAYALTYTRVITSTLLNEARFNTTRFAWNQMATSGNVNWGIPRLRWWPCPSTASASALRRAKPRRPFSRRTPSS